MWIPTRKNKTSMLNKDLRRRIVEGSKEYKLGHCGSALSCLDTINYLYKNVLTKDDIFILSKGHGSMALYTVLEKHKGIKMDWTMHPELDEEKGIFATTGSLGHGLPIAVGRAFAKKLKKVPGNVYVLLGDGEMAEGSVWEALLIANNLKLDNLVILVDVNKYGAVYPIADITSDTIETLQKKIAAFIPSTCVIDGHDESELEQIKKTPPGPSAIILDTIKGKGLDFLEQSHAHGFNFFFEPEKYVEAMEKLK